MENEKLYRANEVAEKLELHKDTILRLIREGKMKAVRIGREYRVSQKDIDDYIAINTNPQTNPQPPTPTP